MRFEIECSFERNKATSKIVQDSFRMGEEDEKAIGFEDSMRYEGFCLYLEALAYGFSTTFGNLAMDLFSKADKDNLGMSIAVEAIPIKVSKDESYRERFKAFTIAVTDKMMDEIANSEKAEETKEGREDE